MAYDLEGSSSQYIGYGTGGGVGATNDISCLAYVRFESLTANVCLVCKRDSYATGEDQFYFGYSHGSNLAWAFTRNAQALIIETGTISTDTDYFVGWSNSSTGGIFYQNSIAGTDHNPQGNINLSSDLRTGTGTDQVVQIGATDTTPGSFLDGLIGNVAIYNVALTATELQMWTVKHVCPLLIRPSALVHYWPLVGSSEDIVGGLTGTETNSPTPGAAHPNIIYPRNHQRTFAPGLATVPPLFYHHRHHNLAA